MRKAIPPKIRFQVLNRDNFECKYCWLKAGNWIQLQIDHIIAVSEWWSNNIDNLITSCFECNSGKWKTNKSTKENDLYKIKKEDRKNEIKNIFQESWNKNNLWLIDKNTYILLMRYIDVCVDFGIECWIDMYSYINKIEFEKVKAIYRTWWDICSLILKDSGNEDWYFPYEDELWSIINEVKKDIWKWNCWNNYSNRLNYTLTELLIDDVPFSFLMKFSYFYNEIKNEQN